MKAKVSREDALNAIENCIMVSQVTENKYIENQLKRVLNYFVSLQKK